MRLYVDVDETLVFWKNKTTPQSVDRIYGAVWGKNQGQRPPFDGRYTINKPLVRALKQGIDSGEYDVTIWSAAGEWWAGEISKNLFNGYNLPTSGKFELYHSIPDNSYAIDDRLLHDRFYLYKFQKVFLPEEFVDYAKQTKPMGQLLYQSIKRGDWGTEE